MGERECVAAEGGAIACQGMETTTGDWSAWLVATRESCEGAHRCECRPLGGHSRYDAFTSPFS
jgi:hypothetical protein